MKKNIALQASQLASLYFKDNLLLSFVGGSYARNTHKPDSDVDLFVILKKADRKKEIEFALAFRQFHIDNSLKFKHCGEIFNTETLDSLINYTIQFLPLLPEIQQVGCYHGDCMFSIFRKGDVVLKFFEEAKIFINGDMEYMRKLEAKSRVFFEDFPMERIQHQKGNLKINDQGMRDNEINLNKISQTDAFVHTPIGVGLERWFQKTHVELPVAKEFHLKIVQRKSGCQAECPLNYYPIDSYEGHLYSDQCLFTNFRR